MTEPMLRLRLLALLLTAGVILAQEDRITAPVDPGRTAVLSGHRNPRALAQYDQGLADDGMAMDHVTLLLKPAAALDAFLDRQRTPSSPDYHRWLTPAQFADRFGLSSGDIGRLESWLRSQGLRVDDAARGRHWITFSGTAGQVGRALKTEIHRYQVDGETHYAAAADPSIPAAFAAVVGGFNGLDDF